MTNIFEEIAAAEKISQEYLTLQAGEKRILKFDTSQISIVDTEYQGKKQKKVQYIVTDPNAPFDPKKLRLAFVNAKQLNALLQANILVIKIERIGSGLQTRYTFAPATS